MTYGDSVFPAVDGNGEEDVSCKYIVSDGCWTVKQERIIEGPDIGADTNPKVEELFASDMVIGHNHVGITASVLRVHHVNCTEAALCGGRRDRVLRDGASGGPENDNPTIGAPGDLYSRMNQQDVSKGRPKRTYLPCCRTPRSWCSPEICHLTTKRGLESLVLLDRMVRYHCC